MARPRDDLRAAIDLGVALSSVESPVGFGEAALPPLRQLVACDSATYNEVDLRRHHVVAAVDPPDALDHTDPSAFAAHLGQHPVVAYSRRTGDGRAHTISDFVDLRTFRRSDLYATYFRDAQTEHQAAVTIAYRPSVVVGIALNRSSRDFGQRDRQMLDLVRPQLVAARRAVTVATERRQLVWALEAGLEDSSRGVILATRRGEVVAVSAEACRLMATHQGVDVAPGAILPRRLADLARGAPSRSRPLTLEGHGARLHCRVLDEHDDGNRVIAIDERARFELPPLATAHLTERESAILFLLASGKANTEIAAQMNVSIRTVHKHLEHLYEKLDVHDRAAAVSRWFADRDES